MPAERLERQRTERQRIAGKARNQALAEVAKEAKDHRQWHALLHSVECETRDREEKQQTRGCHGMYWQLWLAMNVESKDHSWSAHSGRATPARDTVRQESRPFGIRMCLLLLLVRRFSGAWLWIEDRAG